MESLHVHSATEQITTNFGEMELNGNLTNENDDLSEYTDAEESLSAPIEILAEFLSAVMLKDYEKALQYCKIILEYEPNHSTAKEFYPLIQEKILQESKLECKSEDSSTDSDENDDSEDSGAVDSSNRTSSHHQSDSDNTSASYSSLEDEEPIKQKNDNDFVYNGNSTSTTDSESPTEPSQKIQAKVA